MAAVDSDGLTTQFIQASSRSQPLVPISLNVVSPLVAMLDLCWIVLLAAATGALYDVFAHEALGPTGDYLGSGLAVAILYSAFAHAAQLYQAPSLVRAKWQVTRSVAIWVAVFVLLACLVFLLKIGATFSRGKMLLFFSSGLLATVVVRLAVAQICAYVIASRVLTSNRVVVVGCAEELDGNEAFSALDHCGYTVAGVFELPQQGNDGIQGLKVCLRDVVSFVRSRQVDEVLLALPWGDPSYIQRVETELRVLPIPVKLAPDKAVARMLRRPLSDLGLVKVVELQRAPLSAAQRYLKRFMDQLSSAIGLFLLMPFMAVIATAIRLESSGPAIFLQTRIGFNGRPFRICKFRTMSTCDDGPVIVQATKGDKRITHLGALLRKLSIDELPQLLNVLRGEMSLVGPRPHAVAHDNEYDSLIATYAIRHKIKPGITGWAQVNGFRGETPEIRMMKQRVESDIWYIECWSLWLDIRILLLTVVRAWKSDRAY